MEIDITRESAAVAERVERVTDTVRERMDQAGPLAGSAKSPDGTISVTVAPGGLITGITLTEAALAGGSTELARNISKLVERATRRAGDAVYRALAPALPAGALGELASLGYVRYDEDDGDAGDDYRSPIIPPDKV
ncbi:hypothetical protein EV193_10677 [Herbihabitans rhizosphaerae]|uniref:YbaB/EbfC DNA-binding family protein n=1 Tax=Herbihabitans rhizosphaerae TaxID=1872711 RepID=A0A4V2ESA0_9PSEU|nr:YbaB/EbfC family DNA-binding protein [Herbihabitans rhizosphaerae]RZS36843.1 hypothetical protein EV193_10677 [Herbihabitans rhizosphaerae]